ncbi:MAG: inorganic pyrophosphatase [Chloroflexi bacterium]|nr:inorganic pyrophosphatase [Chloroflexota bacterium]
MNPDDFWQYLERLVAGSRVINDRSKGSRHPQFPNIIYPLDHGYLDRTTSSDGGGIDVWAGASWTRCLSVVILTVDLHKRGPRAKSRLAVPRMKSRPFS